MYTESIHNIFEIRLEELTTWDKRPHKHNFFEIVYVEQGTGVQCINQHRFRYQADNIFLLPPLDCHSFKIEAPSRFYFIRFSDHFFHQPQGLANYQAWFDRIAYILSNYNKVAGDIIDSENDRQFIINSIQSLHREYLAADSFSHEIISGTVASILNLLARSIEKKYVAQANEADSRFGEILRFIHTHLTDTEKLSISHLAEVFALSPSYFSEYFKKHAGISLGAYILKSKLKIVETKVVHTDLSLKEIAYQLNFTDSSHLARSFKKAYGMTVKEFRQSGRPCCME